MPMLFKCLVALLFLLAYNNVYAETCTDICHREYVYASRYCDGLCSRAGALTFYCYLRCVDRVSSASEYAECIKSCTGCRLTKENCRDDCKAITHNAYMCNTICQHDEDAPLISCLFGCAKTYPPTEECANVEVADARCHNPGYSSCSEECYAKDTKYLKSLE
uniref:ShKT domain-containing protein n=1 Tax=Trichobilharzia regenti TaxID=157069 RepID=A0AA85KDG6_TRIRE|nr:unnamed protein product [Trichobilharzia regenti]